MAAQNKNLKKQEKKEKNYRSRYDVNRPCYRKDKTHYVYQEWVETRKNQGFYHDHVFTVGKDGVTLELLDYLMATDNGEVQDQEDDERYKELLAESMPAYAKSPEEELCADDEEEQSPLSKEFDEKVRPNLSGDQMNLIYDRYGAGMILDEIAAKLPPNKDGSLKTHQAVSGRLNRIFGKVRKNMAEE